MTGDHNILLNNSVSGADTDDQCKFLDNSNSTIPIAAEWENIPETLIVNSIIGAILFILFVIMTCIAWRRSKNMDDYINQGLITFLYGYRDPERWYVIPRYEFLTHKERHHKHDLEYPNIYVPPKLPLANPIELLAHGHQDYSLDEQSSGQGSLKTLQPTVRSTKSMLISTNQSNSKIDIEKGALKEFRPVSLKSDHSELLFKTAKTIDQMQIVVKKEGSRKDTNDSMAAKSSFITRSVNQFVYPSILTAGELQASCLTRMLNRFFSKFFRVTDSDIIFAKGIDAYEYLLFQRHLIFILFVTNIFCIGIILPVHWLAPDSSSSNVTLASFQRTTIKNMSPDSLYYWAHIISSVCIVVITLYVLNSYRESTIDKNDSQLSRRTLLVGNIPVRQRDRRTLLNVIRKYFPTSTVEAIQFAYDISLLERYQLQLDATLVAKDYCFYQKRKYNTEIMVKQTDVNEDQVCGGLCRLCSFFYICCCFWPLETKQPGTIFYPQRELYYRNKIKETCEHLVKNPSEYAFVTFKTYKKAKRVMEELSRLKAEAMNQKLPPSISSHDNVGKSTSASSRRSRSSATSSASRSTQNPQSDLPETSNNQDPLDPLNDPHIRSIRTPIKSNTHSKQGIDPSIDNDNDKQLNSAEKLEGPLAWSVRYAPHPDNVEYYDLLNIATTSKYTITLLHILMVIIFIFITTPNVILSMLERWSVLNPDETRKKTGFQALVINYISLIVQIITTALLPALVILISKQIPYEDSASKTHSTMWKVYLFLVLMVIIMPSIGMSSAAFLFDKKKINIRCLFPTDNGAYFINYVLSSIFISTLLELIKPIDILSYCFILWTGRSSADFEGGRQFIEREFSVSMQHTGVLLVFSAVMTYAVSCPLIAPAGLIYLLVKHAVDHYHLFYTYFTKKVDKNLKSTITIFVRVALLLMLFQQTIAVSINTGVSYFSLITQIIFWVTLAASLFNCFFDYTSKETMAVKRSRYSREFCACFYLPRVIENLLRTNAIPAHCISRKI